MRELPKYKRGRDKVKNLYVRNTSGRTLTGLLRVFVDRWDAAGRTLLAEMRCEGWTPGAAKSFAVDIGALAPDANVALASFQPYFDEKVVFTAE
ncbi:MAG: hypothetical protein KBT68_07950, partial [bacterium]|nr:hypothetical protein [Candidatus Colisoma equi]